MIQRYTTIDPILLRLQVRLQAILYISLEVGYIETVCGKLVHLCKELP